MLGYVGIYNISLIISLSYPVISLKIFQGYEGIQGYDRWDMFGDMDFKKTGYMGYERVMIGI